MKTSSALFKQIVKAQKAMRKWPKELKRDLEFISVDRLSVLK